MPYLNCAQPPKKFWSAAVDTLLKSETLTYTRFPREQWQHVRTNNAIESLNRETSRRTRIVGTFPDGNSAIKLATARLK